MTKNAPRDAHLREEETCRKRLSEAPECAKAHSFSKGGLLWMRLFTPPTLEVPSSMQSCWHRKRDFRHSPLQKRRNGTLSELKLSILAGSWPVRLRAMPRLRRTIGCAPSAASVWDKPEHREKACGKSQRFQPTFRCSHSKEILISKSSTAFTAQ